LKTGELIQKFHRAHTVVAQEVTLVNLFSVVLLTHSLSRDPSYGQAEALGRIKRSVGEKRIFRLKKTLRQVP
jgi:hypothetical protein